MFLRKPGMPGMPGKPTKKVDQVCRFWVRRPLLLTGKLRRGRAGEKAQQFEI